MSEINLYIIEIASRLAERAEFFHQASLRHLEASRQLYAQGLRGEHDATLAAGYGREALKHDSELRRLLREYPQLRVCPSNYLAMLTANESTTSNTDTSLPENQNTFDVASLREKLNLLTQ
jgi:hypothetical protein